MKSPMLPKFKKSGAIYAITEGMGTGRQRVFCVTIYLKIAKIVK